MKDYYLRKRCGWEKEKKKKKKKREEGGGLERGRGEVFKGGGLAAANFFSSAAGSPSMCHVTFRTGAWSAKAFCHLREAVWTVREASGFRQSMNTSGLPVFYING